MNKRETREVASEVFVIGLIVTGTRRYGRGQYALDVVDPATGIPFAIDRREQWDERRRAAEDQ